MTDSECALAHVVAQATGLLPKTRQVWAMLLGSAQEKMLQKSRQDTNPGSADLAAACAAPANPILSSPCLLEFFSQFKFPRKHKTQFVLMQPTQECCVEEHGSHLPACPPSQSLPSPAQLLLWALDSSFLFFIPFMNWSVATEVVDLPYCGQDPALGLARLGLPCAFCEVESLGPPPSWALGTWLEHCVPR